MKRFSHNASPNRKRSYTKSTNGNEASCSLHLPSSSTRPRKALLSHPYFDGSRSRRENFTNRSFKNAKNYSSGRTSSSVRESSDANSSRTLVPNHLSGRMDPMLAAATAAAAMVNLGLVPPTSTSLPGLTSGSNPSTASAVAALALNAAAMAAALGAGTTNRALFQQVSNNRSLVSADTSNVLRKSISSADRESSSKNRWGSSSTRGTRLQSPQSRSESERDSLSHIRFPHHLDHRNPEDDPTATRTLFVGNLMPEITEEDLRIIFERYGFIEDIDIKRRDPESGINAYAFIRFINLDMAHRAKVDMSGQPIGQFTCKIGYGKVVPTRCLWIGGLGPWITYPAFATLLNEFGPTEKIIWPSGKNYANALFPTVEQATVAADALRGYPLGGPNRRIRIDFTDESHMNRDHMKRRRAEASMTTRHVERAIRESPCSPRECFDISTGDNHRSSKREYRSSMHVSDTNRQSLSVNESRRKYPRTSRDTSKYDSRRSSSPPPKASAVRKQSHSPKQKTDTRVVSVRSSTSNIQSAATVDELAGCLPVAWTGAFFLKSSSFPCRMHILRGDQTLVDQFMSYRSLSAANELDGPQTDVENLACLRITQRMKLDPVKLDDVSQRISTAGNAGFCVLLAVPARISVAPGTSDNGKQPQRPLRNLISYLRTKESAGVVVLGPSSRSTDASVTGVLHAFPPCDFAFSLLQERAVGLVKETGKDDHLVILLIRSTCAV